MGPRRGGTQLYNPTVFLPGVSELPRHGEIIGKECARWLVNGVQSNRVAEKAIPCAAFALHFHIGRINE